jgi:hypothetical protein
MRAWTTASDIRAKVQRRWDDGGILRAMAADAPFPLVDVPVRGPQPADIGDDLGAVRAWILGLEAGGRNRARYTLRYATVGGRLIGRNDLPVRAIIDSYEQAAALLGVSKELQTYKAVLSAAEPEPVVLAWVAANPLRALEVADLWPTLLYAYRWLHAERGSGRYLREINVPGVDTKFVERHRPLLAQLLGVPSAGPGFLAGLGLGAKPETVRLRPSPAVGLTAGLSDLTVRLDELAKLDLTVACALVIENEITFLSVPVPSDGVVLWGKGFEVDRAGALPWLADAEVVYWGDLDTHGFAILNQLRAWLPQTRSVLMDRGTLLAHRDRWVAEPSPTAARLDRLTSEELALYQDLVTDRLGERVRLEQERVAWNWATHQLLC